MRIWRNGRRAGFRFQFERVQVQVLLSAPSLNRLDFFSVKRTFDLFCFYFYKKNSRNESFFITFLFSLIFSSVNLFLNDCHSILYIFYNRSCLLGIHFSGTHQVFHYVFIVFATIKGNVKKFSNYF